MAEPTIDDYREQNRKHMVWHGELQAEVKRLSEAVELMLAEIEGIEVGFENGCKSAAIMVGMEALGLEADAFRRERSDA